MCASQEQFFKIFASRLAVEVSRNCSWDARKKGMGTSKALMGKSDVILKDSHFDTRNNKYTLMNVIVPEPVYA